MADNDPKTKAEETPPALADGTRLEYVPEDAGMDFPDLGLFLAPGVIGVVGEDLDGELAQRFVDRGVLRVVAGKAAKSKAADTPAS